MEIQRIRLDPQGLLTQDLFGKMRRLQLNETEVLSIKKFGEPALKALSDRSLSGSSCFSRQNNAITVCYG